MRKALFAALISVPGLAGLVGAVLLSLLVWFFAPALLGVEALWVLGLLAALPLVIWLIAFVWWVRRAVKRDAALVSGATEVDPREARAAAAAQASRDEEAAVAAKLSDALLALKTAGGGRGGFLYERPWYVLIGPPGAGKTTAIRNSGLDFPLAEGRVSGVGGTRHCDWWIAEQAVLIDTAGRYTTQDSDARADQAGWQRFLELLKRHRPSQPLNGVVVTFGVDLLSRLDAAGREQHARAVRKRLQELERSLGQRLPVYFLVSKADLLVGFTEFFDDLDRDARQQVWGTTFPEDITPEGHAGLFPARFGALCARLQDRLLERLQAERGAAQRAAIAGFPVQFASLEPPLTEFVQAAFGGSKLEPAPLLRGVYFTSGTQEGTPIDRLTGALSRSFGLHGAMAAAAGGTKGRSYFLGRLLRDVVFNEARLAARDRHHLRRQRSLRMATGIAAALLVVVGVSWGWFAAGRESSRTTRVAEAVDAADAAARDAATRVGFDKVGGRDDLPALVPYLDRVRLVGPAADGGAGGMGLSQRGKLQESAAVGYAHVLERTLLPRLLAGLEQRMREQLRDPEALYLATRVYLMLGRNGPMDSALVSEWMAADWLQRYPGAVNEPLRAQLVTHLERLLTSDFAAYPVDGDLVDAARRSFSHLPMDKRVYARLRASVTEAPPWRADEALGPTGRRLFRRLDGAPLASTRVDGVFTVEGLHRGFLPRLPKAVRDAASETWVLGADAPPQATDTVLLERAILERYGQEYASAWQGMLASIELVPLGAPAEAADALNLLAAPKSPLRDLMQAVARQLDVATPAGSAGPSGVAAAAAAAASAAPGVAAVSALAGAGNADTLRVIGSAVDALVGPLREAAASPLEPVYAALNDLYTQVARVATQTPGSSAPVAAGAGLDAAQRLQAEAQRLPEPLAGWLARLARGSSAVQAGGTRAAVAAAAGQQLAPFCRDVEKRFPFARDQAAPDMPLGDFLRLFGPGGALQQFFDANLRELVDTSQTRWRPAVIGGVPAPVSAADVTQFQNATAIRNAFFPGGLPGQPADALRFELVPTGGTGGALEVDGNRTVVAAGPAFGAKPVVLQWPARGSILLSFDGMPPATALAQSGPWAALRLVARGTLTPTTVPDRMRLTFQQGTRALEFELRSGSIVHPFALPELAAFRCPRLSR